MTAKSSFVPTFLVFAGMRHGLAVIYECYMVDPASSHMLVSKIKPCMFKKVIVEPWDGSPGPPSVSTGRLVPSLGDTLMALTGRDFDPIVLAFGIGVMINRDSRGHSYFIVRGGVLSQGCNLKELTKGNHQEWSLRLNLTQHGETYQEFQVSASHQLALTMSLPFVHTACCSYRLNDPVKCSERGDMDAFGYHQTSARKVSRKMQLNSLLSPTRRRCLFGSSPAMQTLKRLLATDILALASMKNLRPTLLAEGTSAWVSQITARGWPKSEVRTQGASRHAVVNSILVISPVVPVQKLLMTQSLQCDPRSVILERGAKEGESPIVPGPCRTRGVVYESGCLGMQPQSDGKFFPRLNMGVANKYYEVKISVV
ncbi:hypothetical protein Bca4012_073427 [Brassica carinata]